MINLIRYNDYGRLWRVYGRSVVRYGTPRKVWNAVRTEWAYRRRRVDVPSRPYFLNVEPLYYCNLTCPLCDRQGFAGARKDDAGRLSLDLLERVLDEMGPYLFQCHIFGLGEPLLDWTLTREIIRRVHARRIFSLVSTNCTLVTPRVAREIVDCGLDHLVCAIDGVTQESYERYRVGGRVEAALENLRLIVDERRRRRSGLFIEWQFLVNGFNVGEIPAARALADELGVYLRLAPMRGMEWDARLQKEWLPADGPWQDARVEPGRPCSGYACYHLWRTLVLNSNGKLTRCPIYQNVAEYGHAGGDGDGAAGERGGATVMGLYDGPSSRRARELFSRGPVADGPFPAPCTTCSFFTRERGGPYADKGWTAAPPPQPPGRPGTPVRLRIRRETAAVGVPGGNDEPGT